MNSGLKCALMALLAMCAWTDAAQAVIYRFTATSGSAGLLGTMDFDGSVFSGSSNQLVTNNHMLSIDFAFPSQGIVINSPGPSGDGTYFESSGLLPIVTGGFNFTGQTPTASLYIAGDHLVQFNSSAGSGYHISFFDVRWSTTEVLSNAPEPASWALMLFGFGCIGSAMRRTRKTAVSVGSETNTV